MVSPEELEILSACLGSSEPYDRLTVDSNGIHASSENLGCELKSLTPLPFQGLIPGAPFLKFHQFSQKGGQEIQYSENGSTLTLSSSSGTVKLPILKHAAQNPLLNSVSDQEQRSYNINAFPDLFADLNKLIDANGSTELQVLKMDMLGAVLTNTNAYCLSLQALVEHTCTNALPEALPRVLLPSKFIQLLHRAVEHYQALLVKLRIAPSSIVAQLYLDLEQERPAPLRLATAVPILDKWVDVMPIRASQGFITLGCPVDLSELSARLSLLDLTGMDKVTLSGSGARCIAPHADVDIPFVLPLEQPITVPLQKFARLLQLCPRLHTYDTTRKLLVLQGDGFIAYLVSL